MPAAGSHTARTPSLGYIHSASASLFVSARQTVSCGCVKFTLVGCCVSILCVLAEMECETIEVMVPEPLAVRKPVAHRAESFRCEAVTPLPAVSLLRHKACIKKHAQVL